MEQRATYRAGFALDITLGDDPMLTLILILTGILMSVLGFEYGDGWPYFAGAYIGWAGTLISVLAALRQYRESKPFEYLFTESSWLQDGKQYRLELPNHKHSKGSAATAIVFLKNSNNEYDEVMCDISVNFSGSVVVGALMRFSGKAVVK